MKSPTIQNITFPRRNADFDLYFKETDQKAEYVKKKRTISFQDRISLDTYFNSFFVNPWLKYTKARNFRYTLSLQGDALIKLYFVKKGREPKNIYQKQYKNCSKEQPISFDFKIDQSREDGRFFLCLINQNQAEAVCLHEGFVSALSGKSGGKTNADGKIPQRVLLSIIICTYKKEKYTQEILSTLNALVHIKEHFEVSVIDNARINSADTPINKVDAKPFPAKEKYKFRLKIIPNENSGGSGGFSRGMFESLRNEQVTHLLLMDDDIEFDPEVVFRTIRLFQFADQEFVIAGNMLDGIERSFIFEAGSVYNFKRMRPLNHLRNVNMNLSENLDTFAAHSHADLAGWYYYALPRRVVEKAGLSLPMFIRGDDIEFSLRLKHSEKLRPKGTPGIKTAIVPGIGVWHESFYMKNTPWLRYYNSRNALINSHLYGRGFLTGNLMRLGFFVMGYILLFDYHIPALVLLAMKDFLKGPDFLKKIDICEHHQNLLKIQETSASNPQKKSMSVKTVEVIPKVSQIKKLLFFITLNGHLLPKFFLRKKAVPFFFNKDFMDNPLPAALPVFGYSHVLESNLAANTYKIRKISSAKAFKIMIRFALLAVKLISKTMTLRRKWKKEHAYLTSPEFWEEKYFSKFN